MPEKPALVEMVHLLLLQYNLHPPPVKGDDDDDYDDGGDGDGDDDDDDDDDDGDDHDKDGTRATQDKS